ncbi:hypothetical protein Hanom_Chr14g01252431 [Helianthus anomalus]
MKKNIVPFADLGFNPHLPSFSFSLSLANREEDSNRIHKSQNELTRYFSFVGSFLPCFCSSSCFRQLKDIFLTFSVVLVLDEDGVRKMKMTILCRSEFSSYIQ